MDQQTIKKLNEINQQFYKKSATDFSQSRAYYWHGWREILPYIESMLADKDSLSVLDVGCGNGRFGSFLVDNLPEISIQYTGIDNNQTLLDIAQSKLSKTHLDTAFSKQDLVESLLTDSFLGNPEPTYDIIVLFGVLHHIPTYQLRKKLIQILSQRLSNKGVFIFTLWRFMTDDQLEKKQVSFKDAGLKKTDVDSNDYILSWERETSSLRYCHYANEQEEQRLVAASGLELLSNFESDGREGRGNKYLVLTTTCSV